MERIDTNQSSKDRLADKVLRPASVVHVEGVRLLLDTLSLACRGTFGDSTREEGHKLSDRAFLVEGERREIRSRYERSRFACINGVY